MGVYLFFFVDTERKGVLNNSRIAYLRLETQRRVASTGIFRCAECFSFLKDPRLSESKLCLAYSDKVRMMVVIPSVLKEQPYGLPVSARGFARNASSDFNTAKEVRVCAKVCLSCS